MKADMGHPVRLAYQPEQPYVAGVCTNCPQCRCRSSTELSSSKHNQQLCTREQRLSSLILWSHKHVAKAVLFDGKTFTKPSNMPETWILSLDPACTCSFCQALQFAVQLKPPQRVMHVTSNVMV